MSIIISTIIMLILDKIYLSSVSNGYSNMLKTIQGSPLKIKILPAILCYILLIFGINYFIIQHKKSPRDAFILGFVIYGVFELTNYAIINKWQLWAVTTDTIWGGILFALTTYFTYKLREYIKI